jgi:penicillin amidase
VKRSPFGPAPLENECTVHAIHTFGIKEVVMRKKLLVPVIICAVVVGLVVLVVGARSVVLRRPFPRTKGRVEVEGLQAPAEIIRDSNGVPHIYAESMEDLFFAQGYVHAQDRFWQMDFFRRAAAGRISELFGEAVLGVDIYIKTMGFGEIVEREYPLLDPDTRKALDSYAAGINAYIQNRKPSQLGIQYTLLGLKGVEVEIEPWIPQHTLLWYKLMAEQMSGGSTRELHMLELIRAAGVNMAADFFPDYREDVMPYIISDDELGQVLTTVRRSGGLQDMSEEHLALLQRCSTGLLGGYDTDPLCIFGRGRGIGSNSWVIAGSRTATGMPLLANDTHLRITIPPIYYEIGLHSKEGGGATGEEPLNLRGFSVPGSFGIMLGQNDRIAWGFTTMDTDLQDLYIERINPWNPNQYEVNGEWRDMALRVEEIKVHDRDEPYRLLVRSTRHGPIVTDHGDMSARNNFNIIPEKSFPTNLELTALALRWTALQPLRMPDMVLRLNRARNFDEFHEALRHMTVPVFNVVYADVDGNIGYQAPGLIPIRARGDGRVPVPGWTDDYEWIGYVPYEDMPRILNPEKGYVVTANNAVVSPRYPYDLAIDFDYGYRARRISEMIEQRGGGLTLEDMKQMQADTLNLSALEILPFMRDIRFDDEKVAEALEALFAWDGRMEMESSSAVLYGYFWVALVEEIFQDELPDRLWNKDGGVMGADSSIPSKVYDLLEDPSNRWWDDVTTLDTVETRDEVLALAFEKGYRRCVKDVGEKQEKWRWGDVHTATFRDQTFGRSGIPLIEKIFNRGPVSTAGGFHQVNRSDFSIDEPFEVYHITSNRHVLDLSDLSNSEMILPTGQSGHPGNAHYDDMIDRWRFVEYHPARWDKEDVEADSKGRLVLKPL